MTPNEILLLVLTELDKLISGSETPIYAEDDPSGCMTEYAIDSEELRRRIGERIQELGSSELKRLL